MNTSERIVSLLEADVSEARQTGDKELLTRSLFYLARSFQKEAPGMALERYMTLLRERLVSNDEEAFWCMLGVARCCAALGMTFHAVAANFEQVYRIFPRRAETLRALAVIYRSRASELDAIADSLPLPHNAQLFVETSAYGRKA